jgi:phage gpG-like protein
MVDIQLAVDTTELERMFQKVSAGIGSMTKVMEKTSLLLLDSAYQNFSNESARAPYQAHVAPQGFWADLAESTKRQRSKQGLWPGKKLQRTGTLLASLERTFTDKEASAGTNIPYGKWLHYGTKKMPARPFLALQDADAAKIRQLVEEHLQEILKITN